MKYYIEFFTLSLFFGASLSLPAATITIETTCQPAQQAAFTTNNGCSVPMVPPTPGHVGGGAVTATGSASFTLAPTAADWSTLQVYAMTLAYPLDASTRDQPALFYTTQASSQVTFSTVLTTTGPVRPGYVRIEAYDSGSHAAGVDGNSGSLTFGSMVTGNNGTAYHTFSITLGESFNLQYVATAFAYGTFTDGPGYAATDYHAQFRFFEADDTTPVAVSESPEPSTFVFLGFDLLGFGWWGKRSALSS